MKKCTYCDEEIQDAAIVCKHCGRDLNKSSAISVPINPARSFSWGRVVKVLLLCLVILVTFGTIIYMGTSNSSNSANPSSPGAGQTTGSSNSSDLNAKVSHDLLSINVTNQENTNWDNCMVGVNGSTGWGFDNPPYQTHGSLTISAGKTITVPYARLTAQDGSFFDRSTHAVNSIVVVCFRDSGSERSWVGTPK